MCFISKSIFLTLHLFIVVMNTPLVGLNLVELNYYPLSFIYRFFLNHYKISKCDHYCLMEGIVSIAYLLFDKSYRTLTLAQRVLFD
jgi:hypothetical protein